MKRLSAIVALTAAAALAQTTPAPQHKAATPPAAQKGAAPAAPQREPGLYATFRTSMGNIEAILYEKEAPVTVANFVALARGAKRWKDPKSGAMVARPLYNGVTFHRVIKNFMIQTGDPTGTGAHDCGFTIKDEIVPTLKYDRPGRLGMANVGSPHTGACQFFITQKPYPGLDPPNGAYTIFGQVVEGQDVVDKIDMVPTDANDKPRTPVRIISVTIHRVGPPPAPAVRKTVPAAKKAVPAVKKAVPAAPKK